MIVVSGMSPEQESIVWNACLCLGLLAEPPASVAQECFSVSVGVLSLLEATDELCMTYTQRTWHVVTHAVMNSRQKLVLQPLTSKTVPCMQIASGQQRASI